MKCTEYAPLVCRYLDDDLEGRELEAFLEHLSGCAGCLKEMEELEHLRGWLLAADAQRGLPEPTVTWGIEDLLRNEAAAGGGKPLEPFRPGTRRGASGKEKKGVRSGLWIRRPLLPLPLMPRPAMLYALPLLLVMGVAAWLYSRDTGEWIDVQDLKPQKTAAMPFSQEEGQEIEFYVVQHAAHQPWMQYGDEVPMLRLASTPSR
jgi:hypothetical protein